MDPLDNYSRREILLLSTLTLTGCQTESNRGASTTTVTETTARIERPGTTDHTDTVQKTSEETANPETDVEDPSSQPTTEQETATSTTTPEKPKEHVVDLKDAQGNNIGNTNTEREWDNHRFNREELHEEYISDWTDEAAYDQVMQEIQEENSEKYNGESINSLYSNSDNKLGEEDELGHWDPEWYSDRNQLEHIIRDAQNVVRTHQREVHPDAYSNWNNRFAATLQEIVNNHNEYAENYEGERKAFHAGFIDENQHGTVITYTDLENTEIEGKHPWQFVDTTSWAVNPVTEDIDTGGVFNPFVDGYEPESQTRLGYESEKKELSVHCKAL